MTPATEELLKSAIDLVEARNRGELDHRADRIPDAKPFERLDAAVERFRREEL